MAAPRRTKKKNPDWDYLRERYAGGLSYRSLAALPEADGISYRQIARKGDAEGWERGAYGPRDVKNEARMEMAYEAVTGMKFERPPALSPLDELKYHEVDLQKAVIQRQQCRVNALHDTVTELVVLAWQAVQTGIVDERLKDYKGANLVDALKKLVSMNAVLQQNERTAFSLDTSVDDLDVFVPKIAKREFDFSALTNKSEDDDAAD